MSNNVANAYRVRATRVDSETQRALGRVGSVLRDGQREAMQEEIYDRTPLPVTRKLYNSVVIQFLGRTVQVFTSTVMAPYAGARRRMSGVARDGHQLDTQWEKTAAERKRSEINQIMKGCHKSIFGSGRNRSSF